MNTMLVATLLMITSAATPLPQDQDACHLSLFLSNNWKNNQFEKSVYDNFMKDPQLSAARSECFFHVYTPSDMIYRTRFVGAIDLTPTILLQDSDGTIYYKNSQLNSDYKTSFMTLFNKRPWLRVRPWLRPKPEPCPGPEPCPEPNPVPDTIPDRIPDINTEPEFPWVLLIVVVVTAGCLGFLVHWSKRT